MECLFITEEPFIIVGSIRGYSCTRQIRTNIVIACDIADGIFDLRIIFTSPAGLKIDFFGGKCIESIYRTAREKVGDRKYADCRGSFVYTYIHYPKLLGYVPLNIAPGYFSLSRGAERGARTVFGLCVAQTVAKYRSLSPGSIGRNERSKPLDPSRTAAMPIIAFFAVTV